MHNQFFFMKVMKTIKCRVCAASGECSYENGETYKEAVSLTSSGKACQYWGSNFPHKITYEYLTLLLHDQCNW